MTYPHIRAIHLESQSGAVILDAATRRNLEIDQTLSGGEEHTLYAVYDSTVTAMGARDICGAGCTARSTTSRRHRENGSAAVDAHGYRTYGFEPLREALNEIADLERILSRVALGSARPTGLESAGE